MLGNAIYMIYRVGVAAYAERHTCVVGIGCIKQIVKVVAVVWVGNLAYSDM